MKNMKESTTVEIIKLRPVDIPAVIHERVNKLISEFGPDAKPLKILLGPNEMLLLSEFCKDNIFYGNPNQGHFKFVTEFMGYPIGLKRSAGIELEFKPCFATIFAHREIV